jgi:hypothetical protein
MHEMRRFWVLVLYLGAAQAAVNVSVWLVSGHARSPQVYLTIISACSILVFAVLARASHVGARASSYMRFLLVEFLFTVGEATIVIAVSPAHAMVAGLTVGLAAAAALFAVAATYDLPARSYLLDFVSRRIFRQNLAPGFGLPDGGFGEADIQRVVPRSYPPATTGDGDEPEDTPPDRLADDLARATAWAEGLLAAAHTASPGAGTPVPVTTSVGFVQSRDGHAKLAVIHYFRPRQLFKALLTMPKSIEFAERPFPVFARPWQPVEHRHRKSSRPSVDSRVNDGHCWVTFGDDGESYGVVTAAHVIVPADAATGTKVRADMSRTPTPGILRAKSVIMDAALIKMGGAKPDFTPAPHSTVPGYKPIRLCAGRGPADGLVLELFGFIGGNFTRNPDGEPEMRALMTLNVAGQAGDSGCLVLDREFERGGTVAPYLMYLGIIQLADRQAGRGLFLDQVAYHWQVEFQFRLPPLASADADGSADAGASARGQATGVAAPVIWEKSGSTAQVPWERPRARPAVSRKDAGVTQGDASQAAPVRQRGV